MTREDLVAKVKLAKYQLDMATEELQAFYDSIENHVYGSLEDAEEAITEYLLNKAKDACEGSYCCGEDEYIQDFMVDGIRYVGGVVIEYGRHDKTYYYIDSWKYDYEEL